MLASQQTYQQAYTNGLGQSGALKAMGNIKTGGYDKRLFRLDLAALRAIAAQQGCLTPATTHEHKGINLP